MYTAGIIAEYNPFHNGHAWHIEKTRQAGASHIAVVMSGCFTQRGEAALFSKTARVHAALQNDADLVLELPLPWACSPAEIFARGAVGLLNSLGCIDQLSFGSECGEISALQKAAGMLSAADGSPELKAALKSGASLPRAREETLKRLFPEEDFSVLRSPNDTLAIEYLRSLSSLGSRMEPFTVKRRGAGHDSDISKEPGYASASALRAMIRKKDYAQAFACVPASAAGLYKKEIDGGKAPFQAETAEKLILAQLRRLGKEDIAMFSGTAEGLENRIYRAVRESTGLDELLFKIKSKRYTLARIRRILLSAFLGIETGLSDGTPPYLRVLGFNARGREILKRANPGIPLVTRHSDTLPFNAQAKKIYALECLSSDLWALCLPTPGPCGGEQKFRPVVI